jgi:hypothetical protein
VPHPFLPYALVTPSFPFRHLAALAGRAPIGGAREVALGCFVAARLAAERGPAAAELSDEARQARAAGAKSWLGTLTLPAAVRSPLAKCIESSAKGSATAVAREVAAVRSACASYLDASSRAELEALAEALGGDGRAALPARASEP